MKISVTPSASLPISVERQQQIIDSINHHLDINPRRGFCFIGPPGVGKTFLMRAIQQAVMGAYEERRKTSRHPSRPLVNKIMTLASWHEQMRLRTLRETRPAADFDVSVRHIEHVASENDMWMRSGIIKDPPTTLHYFVDEFDSQPTESQFNSGNLQNFVNACYENSSRSTGQGNGADFLQLVVAMNKNWEEFASAYGIHVARRISEMCVRIDFDSGSVTVPAQPSKLDQQIDSIFE